MDLSIVIPCYNEEEVLPQTYARLRAVLNGMAALRSTELLFVNDGSRDKTAAILHEMGLGDRQVKVVSFSRNFGHQAAVSAGLCYSRGDAVVVMDADLQDPPELIPEMVDIWREKKCHVVYGVRQSRKKESLLKKCSAFLYYRMLRGLSETPIPVDTGDFRLIDRKAVDVFNRLEERNKYVRGLVSWMGFSQEPIYYEREGRAAGKTKYPWSRMFRFGTEALIYFSKKPLNLAVNLGFLCLAVGLILAVYALVVRLSGHYYFMAGWASIMIALIFFGGVQLLTVGIIGKYIGSIFDEVKRRPEYIVDETLNIEVNHGREGQK